MDQRRHQSGFERDEVAALLRGVKLGVIALVSAVVTAGLVIGLAGGMREQPRENPHYGELVTLAMND